MFSEHSVHMYVYARVVRVFVRVVREPRGGFRYFISSVLSYNIGSRVLLALTIDNPTLKSVCSCREVGWPFLLKNSMKLDSQAVGQIDCKNFNHIDCGCLLEQLAIN